MDCVIFTIRFKLTSKMKYLALFLISLFPFLGIAQTQDITIELYDTYDSYKEESLNKRRIKHSDLAPILRKIKTNSRFKVSQVGTSIEGKSLSLISLGKGQTSVFLWSQMHGDEPTATQAIFDILNFFDSSDFKQEKKAILDNLTIHFLPMLNPDGAELFQRRNLLGIDINRDALRLQSPEGQTLKKGSRPFVQARKCQTFLNGVFCRGLLASVRQYGMEA